MSRLRRLLFGRHSRDGGGVAVIVGILVASGVLLGMAALVVDVGQLYAEREELQSGADAAAVAVAVDCARVRAATCRNPLTLAERYADANALDDVADVTEVCGNESHPGAPVSWLHRCRGVLPDNLTRCIGTLPNGTRGWVEVHVRTEQDSANRYVLPPVFAQTLAGGYDGATVLACARVAWGAPTRGLPLALCLNEWNSATNRGVTYQAVPPAVPPVSAQRTYRMAGSFGSPAPPYTGACATGAPTGRWSFGADFGWTNTIPGGGCQAAFTSLTASAPGSGLPSGCSGVLSTLQANRTPVAVPILRRTGTFGSWDLVGVAAFVITGYRTSPTTFRTSWLTPGTLPCPATQRCILGYYVRTLLPDSQWTGAFSPTQILGAMTMKTVG